MKKLHYVIISVILGGGMIIAGTALATRFFNPGTQRIEENTATTSATFAPNVVVIDSNPASANYGGCLMIRDKDDGGYTYLTTIRGVATFSVTPCK